MNTITLFGETFKVQRSSEQYAQNCSQPILDIFTEAGMPSGRITICIPGIHLEAGETIVRQEYAELIEDLVKAQIVQYSGRYARSGFAVYPIVKLVQA